MNKEEFLKEHWVGEVLYSSWSDLLDLIKSLEARIEVLERK
jgi:hypothetical protein